MHYVPNADDDDVDDEDVDDDDNDENRDDQRNDNGDNVDKKLQKQAEHHLRILRLKSIRVDA